MGRPKVENPDYCPPRLFDECNICHQPFKRRGLVVDEKDFADHKAKCVAMVDWRKLVGGQIDLANVSNEIDRSL